MTAAASAPDPRAIEALLAFWAEAGVDACLADAPIDRLTAAAPAPALPPPRRASAPVDAPERAAVSGGRVADAQAAAAAATDLEALVAAARAFFPGPTPAVVLEGAAPARLIVVGDAPSLEDEAEGRPFRGARGALVRALLEAAGLADGVLYANTVFRRPRGGGDPAAEAQALAAPFVARAAALARPRAALLLGGCAVRGTTGEPAPILKLRGSWIPWPVHGSAPGEPPLPALATLGPDVLLRRPEMKKQAWGDVLSLAVRLDPAARGG